MLWVDYFRNIVMMKFIKLAAVVVIIVILDVADSEKLSKEQCERWNKVKKHKIPNIHNIPRRCKWMTKKEAASVKKECRLCHEQYPICDLFCKEDGTKFLIACEVFRRGTAHYKMCKQCRRTKCQNIGILRVP